MPKTKVCARDWPLIASLNLSVLLFADKIPENQRGHRHGADGRLGGRRKVCAAPQQHSCRYKWQAPDCVSVPQTWRRKMGTILIQNILPSSIHAIRFSKQNFLSEVTNPFSLPDHTPSFKEFTGSKNNRFLSPAQASKNRIQPPSKVSRIGCNHPPLLSRDWPSWALIETDTDSIALCLCRRQILHFFNTPPGLTEEQLIGIFNIKEVPPTAVRMFPLKTERSSSGLIEFPSVALAVLAIMKCNHIPIESKGKQSTELITNPPSHTE